MRRLSVLLLPVLLAACLSPREQCIAEASRDLTVLRNLIAQTERDIARGYGTERVTVTRPVFTGCKTEKGEPFPCWVPETDTEVRPKAIDLDAERAKLRTMRAKERALERQAAAAIRTCRATYPE